MTLQLIISRLSSCSNRSFVFIFFVQTVGNCREARSYFNSSTLTVTRLTNFVGTSDINDRGDLVFLAEFEGGSWGVITATVPEGNAVFAMLAALTAFVVRVRRCKC